MAVSAKVIIWWNYRKDFMQKVIQKIKDNKKATAAIIVMFFVALFYNILSPYTTDDYAYMYSFADGARITNPFQIFGSLWEHYLIVHGRILPHFFVQFFMIFPKWIFNIVNAVVFAWLIWLMLGLCEKKKFSLLMFIAVPIAFWIYIPAYGQIFLWMTGSMNYSWAYLLSLLYMKFYIELLYKPAEIADNKKILGFSLFSLFFGAYSELISFPVVFLCFIIVCIVMWNEHSVKKYWKYCIPMVTGAMGYLTMLLSPAESTRQAEFSMGLIFKRLIDVVETYYQCARPLLIVWAVLLVIAIYFKVDKKTMIVSGCFFVVNLISMAMLSVASYVVARHYAIPLFYLITAIVVLMQALRGKGQIECISYCICAYIIMTSLWSLWEGTYDIYDVNRRHVERENYIYTQVENGSKELTVPVIRPLTKYSCKYDLMDLRMDDAEPWPNAAIAKYYGLEKIYGK